nr:hypothetical protein [Tanacetum cinerariifolium]
PLLPLLVLADSHPLVELVVPYRTYHSWWVLRWTVLIDSTLVWLTVLIEIVALKTILAVILLSRLMKYRWTCLIRNILTILNEITDCCGLKLLDVIMKYGKIISASSEWTLIIAMIFQIDSCVYRAYLQVRQLSAEDQKSLIEKKKKVEHLRLL